MYPFLVESKVFCVDLYQLKDGRFQMIKEGNLSPFMAGYDYILVEDNLTDFLELLDIPQIEFGNAIIWNSNTKTEYKNYKQLFIKNYLTEENFNHLDLKGLKMYLYQGGYLFVNPALKELLENSKFDYLLFSPGFSRFVK